MLTFQDGFFNRIIYFLKILERWGIKKTSEDMGVGVDVGQHKERLPAHLPIA